MKALVFLDQVIVRAPARPFMVPESEREVLNYYQNKFAREALYTSSESLFKEYCKWEEGKLSLKRKEKMLRSLYKYLLRAHSRSTPFALLASVGVATNFFDDSSYIVHKKTRKTSVSIGSLRKIIENIMAEKTICMHLRYNINTTLFRYNNMLRYLKVHYKESGNEVEVCSLKSNCFFDDLIEFAKPYRTFQEIVKFLEGYTDDAVQIHPYLFDLIKKQILVSELDISLDSEDHLNDLISLLKEVNERASSERLHYWISNLIQLKIRLIRIDKRDFNRPSAYKAIDKCIEKMGGDLKSSKFLHINSFSDLQPLISKNQSKFPLQQLEKLICHLASLKEVSVKKEFVSIKEKFRRRYGENSVPLTVLMDPEIGLGYGNNTETRVFQSNLTNNMLPSKTNLQEMENSFDSSLFERSIKKIAPSVELQPKAELDHNSLKNLPASFSVILSVVQDERGQRKYWIKDIGGLHALHYIGRFCQYNNQILEIARTIARHEESIHSDKKLVEFYHQPHLLACNIMSRPRLFQRSIHYLNKRSNKDEVELQNIHVMLSEDELVLYDAVDRKRILPRISSAHDHNMNTLPLYEFVGDLQSQNQIDNLDISWNQSQSNFFKPRITFGDFILRPAEWIFKSLDVLTDRNLNDQFTHWRYKHKIPDKAIFPESDRELIIDFSTQLGVDLFKQILKEQPSIILREFYLPDDGFARDRLGRCFHNEVILFVKNCSNSKETVESKVNLTQHEIDEEIKHTDANPSDWVYLKFYCNQSQSEKILSCLHKVINTLSRSKMIKSWFFIRFRDPDHHLRIRLKLSEEIFNAQVIEKLSQFSNEQINSGYGWKFSFENYQREWRRYGAGSIAIAESLFYIDSEAFMRFNQAIESEDKKELRWQLGLLFIHDLFDLFEIAIERRIGLLEQLCISAKAEFNIGKTEKSALARSFREKRKTISILLDDGVERSSSQKLLIGINAERSLKMHKHVKSFLAIKNGIGRIDFIISIAHMCMNRVFLAMPRYQEYLIYDLLLNHYISTRAQHKRKRKIKP